MRFLIFVGVNLFHFNLIFTVPFFVEPFKTWNHFKELAAVLSVEEIDAGMKKTMKKVRLNTQRN